MKAYERKNGSIKEVEVELVGSYGTFGNPIICFEGETHVAELCFIKDGKVVGSVCQSTGCDYCNGYHSGCPNNPENASLEQNWVF